MCNFVFYALCNSNTFSVFCINNLAKQNSPAVGGPYRVGVSHDSGININNHLRPFQQVLESICAQHTRKMGRVIFIFHCKDFSRVLVGGVVLLWVNQAGSSSEDPERFSTAQLH